MRTAKPLITLLFLVVSTSATCQVFDITDLGILPGQVSSASVAINDRGQIVGCSDTSNTYYPCNDLSPGHAFLWDNNAGMQDLGTLPGYTFTSAAGINSSGVVVGFAVSNPAGVAAFKWTKKSAMVALPTLPGGSNASASGIGATGIITGSSDYGGSNGNYDAVAWTPDGTIHDLGVPPGYDSASAGRINVHNEIVGVASSSSDSEPITGFTWTMRKGMTPLQPFIPGAPTVAFTLNDSGVVVGNTPTASGTTVHPALWTPDGKVHDLGALSGNFGTAFDLNNQNVVVGYSTLSSGDKHAFVWTSKQGIHDLNTLISRKSGWVLVWAGAINNNNQITGWGTIKGENHAYLLTLHKGKVVRW